MEFVVHFYSASSLQLYLQSKPLIKSILNVSIFKCKILFLRQRFPEDSAVIQTFRLLLVPIRYCE